MFGEEEVNEDESYVDKLNCNVGDKVYVYIKNIFPINKDMFGVITDMEQKVIADYMDMQHLEYKIDIQLHNNKNICIKSHGIFNKYNFITIKELKSQLENNKKEIETALEFVNQKLMHEEMFKKL